MLYNAYLHNHDIHSGDEAVSLLKEDEENKAVQDNPNDAENGAAYPAFVKRMIWYLSSMMWNIVSQCGRNKDVESKKYIYHVSSKRTHFGITGLTMFSVYYIL